MGGPLQCLAPPAIGPRSTYNRAMLKRVLRFDEKRLAKLRVVQPARWIVVLVIMGIMVLLWALWFVGPETPEQRNEVIRTVAALIGGEALLVQLWFTRETIRINTQNTAATIENQKQTQLSALAERFYKATEQLGSASDDVRIGALYSLERLANDHEDYYLQVIKVVCAFVGRRSTAVREGFDAEKDADSAPKEPGGHRDSYTDPHAKKAPSRCCQAEWAGLQGNRI